MRAPAVTAHRWRLSAAALLACAAVTTGCGPVNGAAAGTPAATAPTAAPTATASATGTGTGYSGDPGPGWTLSWSDNFQGTAALRDWEISTSTDGGGNKELQANSSDNVSIAPHGGLTLTATRDGHGLACWYGPCDYSAARIDTKGLFAQEYGLFEARIKVPSGHGIWPAFWMEGSNIDQVHWPAAGEIDVLEVDNKTRGLVSAFLHGPQESYGAYYHEPDPLSSGYHVFGIDWTANGITWLVDGHSYGHVNAYPGWPFNEPFFLILDVAVGGTWPGSPDSTTTFPAAMDVSWVRVYKKN